MGWCLPFQDLGRLVCEFDSEKDGVGAGALCSISLWGMVCQKLMERRQEGGGRMSPKDGSGSDHECACWDGNGIACQYYSLCIS